MQLLSLVATNLRATGFKEHSDIIKLHSDMLHNLHCFQSCSGVLSHFSSHIRHLRLNK